jgi:uncharacterized membrane protein HdeD (DUF308 family)
MKTNSIQSERVDHVWVWTALMGVLLVILGAAIIAAATVSTIAVSWLMGLCLIVGGIAQFFHTYRFTDLHSPAIRFLVAAVSIIAGLVILKSPIVGATGITLGLAVYLFFSGATKAALAFDGSRASGRGWLVMSAVVSFFLGICLFVTFPITSLVIPGTLLGVDLIFYGLSLTLIARSFRRGEVSFESAKIRRVA